MAKQKARDGMKKMCATVLPQRFTFYNATREALPGQLAKERKLLFSFTIEKKSTEKQFNQKKRKIRSQTVETKKKAPKVFFLCL